MEDISWAGIELVIFDVDGTIYEQSKLRRIIFFRLMLYYLFRPWRYRDLLILYNFRKERERKSGFMGPDLQEQQYVWCAQKMNIDIETVTKVVDYWIFDFSNKYLNRCMYPGVTAFFADLRSKGIRIAIYSDYNSEEKLKFMGLEADMEICSTDYRVNSFKPLPAGLTVILSEMEVTKKESCLYIGDRPDLDGYCAEQAGIPFLLVDKAAGKDFYFKLSSRLLNSEN